MTGGRGRAIAAQQRAWAYTDAVALWEVGRGQHPEELPDEETDLGYVAGEAWTVAARAAGVSSGLLGVVEHKLH